MTARLNKVLLIGEVGRDPELRRTASGRAVASFSLAVRRGDEHERRQVDWFNIVAWGGLAESCHRQLGSGETVLVEGRLRNRTWEDSDGSKQSATEVVASELTPLGERTTTPGSAVSVSGG